MRIFFTRVENFFSDKPEGEIFVTKAKSLHRKKANIFNKVHYNTPHKQMVRCVAFSPDGR